MLARNHSRIRKIRPKTRNIQDKSKLTSLFFNLAINLKFSSNEEPASAKKYLPPVCSAIWLILSVPSFETNLLPTAPPSFVAMPIA